MYSNSHGKGVRKGGVRVNPPLNLLCYKNVITYAKEFVYVFVHFLLFDVNLTQKAQNEFKEHCKWTKKK